MQNLKYIIVAFAILSIIFISNWYYSNLFPEPSSEKVILSNNLYIINGADENYSNSKYYLFSQRLNFCKTANELTVASYLTNRFFLSDRAKFGKLIFYSSYRISLIDTIDIKYSDKSLNDNKYISSLIKEIEKTCNIKLVFYTLYGNLK